MRVVEDLLGAASLAKIDTMSLRPFDFEDFWGPSEGPQAWPEMLNRHLGRWVHEQGAEQIPFGQKSEILRTQNLANPSHHGGIAKWLKSVTELLSGGDTRILSKLNNPCWASKTC